MFERLADKERIPLNFKGKQKRAVIAVMLLAGPLSLFFSRPSPMVIGSCLLLGAVAGLFWRNELGALISFFAVLIGVRAIADKGATSLRWHSHSWQLVLLTFSSLVLAILLSERFRRR